MVDNPHINWLPGFLNHQQYHSIIKHLRDSTQAHSHLTSFDQSLVKVFMVEKCHGETCRTMRQKKPKKYRFWDARDTWLLFFSGKGCAAYLWWLWWYNHLERIDIVLMTTYFIWKHREGNVLERQQSVNHLYFLSNFSSAMAAESGANWQVNLSSPNNNQIHELENIKLS